MNATNGEPTELYHYTDARGLLGILNPSPSSWPKGTPIPWLANKEMEMDQEKLKAAVQFLASDVRFMNDTEELKFGTSLLRERLAAFALDPTTPPNFRIAFANVLPFFNPDDILKLPLKVFATASALRQICSVSTAAVDRDWAVVACLRW
jgi:hypothetical protein